MKDTFDSLYVALVVTAVNAFVLLYLLFRFESWEHDEPLNVFARWIAVVGLLGGVGLLVYHGIGYIRRRKD